MTDKKDIICPHCKKPGTWTKENIYRPFCSDRCKLIDLGAWASEKHRIKGEETDDNIVPDDDGSDEK